MNTATYRKNFNFFSDGISELAEILPIINDYMNLDEIIAADQNHIEEVAIQQLSNTMIKNPPTSTNPNHPYTYALNVGAFNVSFRTDKRLSFGWQYKLIDGMNVFVFRATFPNGIRSRGEQDLLNNGWTVHVSNYSYRNRHRRFNNNNNNINRDDNNDVEVPSGTDMSDK